MNCTKCNFQNEETAKFCRNCGVKLGVIFTPSSKLPWILTIIALIGGVILGILFYEAKNNLSEVPIEGTIEEEPVVEEEPQNSQTYDRGVVINGIKWATRNVGEKGTFVSQPHHSGNHFKWKDAKYVCPSGWRLPTKDEFNDLLLVPYRWTNINGVNGMEFGTAPNTIFLPAVGVDDDPPYDKYKEEFANEGLYHSNSISNIIGHETFVWSLRFRENYAKLDQGNARGWKISVRCVAE